MGNHELRTINTYTWYAWGTAPAAGTSRDCWVGLNTDAGGPDTLMHAVNPATATTTAATPTTTPTPPPPPPTFTGTVTFWEEIGPITGGNPGTIPYAKFLGTPIPNDYYVNGPYFIAKVKVWVWDGGWSSNQTLTVTLTPKNGRLVGTVTNLGQAGTPYYYKPQIIDTKYGTATANLPGFGNWNPPLTTTIITVTSTGSITTTSTTTITISPPNTFGIAPEAVVLLVLFAPAPLLIYAAYVRGREGLILIAVVLAHIEAIKR